MTEVNSNPNYFNERNLEELTGSLRGPVWQPDDIAFQKACEIWNGMINKRPAVVVQPSGAADIISSINFMMVNSFKK